MKTTLTRELIVSEAYRVAEADTIAKLSLRGMARHLEVQPQRLYHFFPSLDDLKLAVAMHGRDILMHQLYENLVPVSGRDALYVFADTVFEFAKTHPSFQEMLTLAYRGHHADAEFEQTSANIGNILMAVLTPMIADETKRKQFAQAYLSLLFGYAKLSLYGFFGEGDLRGNLDDMIAFLAVALPEQKN